MLKKLLVVLLTLGLMFTTTACGLFQSTTQKYMQALDKTQKAEDMQVQTQFVLNFDLAKAGEDIKQNLDKFKNITINTDQWIDNKNKKSETQSFVKAGEMLIDSKIYVNGENVYLKSSFTGDKYLDLTSSAKQNTQDNKLNLKEQEKFNQDLQEIWKNSVQNEILTQEGNSIENTPDGDIKVSNLILELNDQKSKNILRKLADLVAKNDSLIALMSQSGAEFYEDNLSVAEKTKLIQDWAKKLPETLENNQDKLVIEKMKLTAKIDKDSHIIDEILEGSILIKCDGELRINFNQHTTRWNIDSGKVKVNHPQINKDNLMAVQDITLNNSDMIKEFIESYKR
ncbi:MAG: hypothetical protein ACYDEJ_13655 [Desulfitobacteriaceae bacterium]